MARSSKVALDSLRRFFRRFFAPPLLELSRTGKILQTLWDASQIQSQQREAYRKIGEIASQLVKDGKLQSIKIERILAKIQQHERILSRQDQLLRNYQRRDREIKIRSQNPMILEKLPQEPKLSENLSPSPAPSRLDSI